MLAEWLPHVLQLGLQLFLVTVTKLLSAHLLGRGEAVKSLSGVKLVLFLQRVWIHVGQVSTTHLRVVRNILLPCPTVINKHSEEMLLMHRLSHVSELTLSMFLVYRSLAAATAARLLASAVAWWDKQVHVKMYWNEKLAWYKTYVNPAHTMSMVFGCGRSSPW